jgi:uncharacterized protein YhbP (UPF0306 family)
MKRMSLRQISKQILRDNQYLVLGTIREDGRVWVCPLVYAADRNHDLYFLSQASSQHSQNVRIHPKVSVTIFDSRQLWGVGVGLQMEGEARIVPVSASVGAFKTYFGRRWPYPGSVGSVKAFRQMARGRIYRFYIFTPLKVWLNDPRAEKDVRVKVSLG